MKKIVLLLLAVFAVSSCSLDDDAQNYYLEVLPIDSFEIPESFVQGRKYEVKIFYKLPSNCHEVNGLYYSKEENQRIVGVQSRVRDAAFCEPIENAQLDSLIFNFEVGTEDSYIFKFYKGVDEDGNDVFEDVEVPAHPYEAPAVY